MYITMKQQKNNSDRMKPSPDTLLDTLSILQEILSFTSALTAAAALSVHTLYTAWRAGLTHAAQPAGEETPRTLWQTCLLCGQKPAWRREKEQTSSPLRLQPGKYETAVAGYISDWPTLCTFRTLILLFSRAGLTGRMAVLARSVIWRLNKWHGHNSKTQQEGNLSLIQDHYSTHHCTG